MRALCFLLFAFPAALHASCSARSPAHALALVELYTADACETCGPANRWLASLAQRPGQVVPVAIHLDGRDYRPGPAPESRASRVRRITRLARVAITHTPRVLLQGKEAAWGTADFEASLSAIARQPAKADLALELLDRNAQGLLIRASGALAPGIVAKDAAIYLATTVKMPLNGFNVSENDPKAPPSEVRILEWAGPLPLKGVEQWLPLVPGARAEESGVVAFIQDGASGEVLQALLRPACGPE